MSNIKHIHKNEKGELLCTICNKYKNTDNFQLSSKPFSYRDNKDYRCTACKSEGLNKSRKLDKLKDPLSYNIKSRLTVAKSRAKRKNLEFNLDIDYLENLWEKQKGLCAISNMPMCLLPEETNKDALSLDRIDSSKGYIKGNVQLVLYIMNTMKSNLNYNELILYCENIIANLKQKKVKFKYV